MHLPKYQVYISYAAKKYRIFLSPNPALDLKFLKSSGFTNLIVLTPPLSFGQAYWLWQKIAEPEERTEKRIKGSPSWWAKILGIGPGSMVAILKKEKRQAQTLLTELNYKNFIPHPLESTNAINDFTEPKTLHGLLRGRILLPSELEKLFLERNHSLPRNLWSSLQVLWLQGRLEIFPAVEKTQDGYKCNRCGQSSKLVAVECGRCASTCMICEECISMGEARSCTPLIATPEAHATDLIRQNHKAKLSFSLTQAQEDAAKQVTEFFLGETGIKRKEACLVWAVCGAGKTEVSFNAIAEALNRGGKVLFAIPRRDVVIELEPRLQKAFPGVKITCLYGGSEDKFQEGQITIATTHQAIRFYKKFSLIVLDEADAYPYQGSKMLYHFVQRAKQPAGKIVYMTATPGKELSAQINKGTLQKVTIPARHHGFPLPEPKFLAAPGLDSSKQSVKIPLEVFQWLHKVVEGDKGQVFIFVPTIKLAEAVALSLREGLSRLPFSFPPQWTQCSHSKDPNRDQKRQQFKEGLFPCFVTTSIMERGITVPRAKVLVLFADYERIFDQGTLIQMAGRSGRSEADPVGEVLFVGKKLTAEIQGACRVIKKMNLEAGEKGYLNA